MILNLYTWIFPAAIFTAAGLRNLSSNVKRKRDPERAIRNRIVWFSFNISIALCFLAGSVFFVNWQEFVWSMIFLYFFIAIVSISYLCFTFKSLIGLPLVMIFVLTVLFFNISLQKWIEFPPGGEIGKYRLLSHDQTGVKAEVSIMGSYPVFIQREEAELLLNFQVIQFNKILFFISSDRYYRLTNLLPESELSDIIINFLEKLLLLTKSTYVVGIEDKTLLYQYSIVLDIDKKNIFIVN